MRAYEVLQKAIPENEASKVAKFLGLSPSLVCRWRRRPHQDDAPRATGQRSILDRICELIDVIFLVNPKGTGLIVEHINAHFRSRQGVKAVALTTPERIAETGAALLKEATEAINALHMQGCTPDTLRELIELRDKADEVIKSVEQTMSEEAKSAHV